MSIIPKKFGKTQLSIDAFAEGYEKGIKWAMGNIKYRLSKITSRKSDKDSK